MFSPNMILLNTFLSLPSALILITCAYFNSSSTINLGFRGRPRLPVGANCFSVPYCFRRAIVYNFKPSVAKSGIDFSLFTVFATSLSLFSEIVRQQHEKAPTWILLPCLSRSKFRCLRIHLSWAMFFSNKRPEFVHLNFWRLDVV